MKSSVIPKIILIFSSLYISGCAVSGCNLIKSNDFTLTFIDSENNPLANISTTCSGNDAGSRIANGYNEQKLVSNAKGEIEFHRNKFGSNYSYWSVGLFSWGYKSSETKVTCSFLLRGKEVYNSVIAASEKSRIVKLEL